MDSQCPCFIYRLVLDLYPSKFFVLVCNQIKWRMLGNWTQNHESLLEQVELSLQDTVVSLLLGWMHNRIMHQPLDGSTKGFLGIAISATC